MESFRFVARTLSVTPKVVWLHSRGAEEDVLTVLNECGVKRTICHWYSGPLKTLDDVISAGHLLSVNPAMIRSAKGRGIIARISRTQILAETGRLCCLGQCERATASKLSNSPSLLRRADDRFLPPLQPRRSSLAVLDAEGVPRSQSTQAAEEDEQMNASALFGAGVRRLVDSSIVGVLIWNLDGRILEANDAFLDMLQYGRDDLVSGGLRWTDLTPAEWRERDERATADLKSIGTVQPYEKEFLRKDGSRVPVLIGAALFDARGNNGVAFALDVSQQKHADAEIRTLKDQLYRENLALREEVNRCFMFEEIVGSSIPLKTACSRIRRVAPTDSTVFISGETGTGKELIARAVHKRSQRAERAFITVNCAALAPTLIASELFGHERGAFTGATQRQLGRFELADGGTIFLDEVGELLPENQVALLRVLQEREFERVGGAQTIRVDVRVITATNRDLGAAAANGGFRQDLFYRLNVFPIEVPPLRERQEDILTLVEYFVHRYAARAGKTIRSIDKKTLDLLQAYAWPGNIRELQNVIERSVILDSSEVFAVDESWLPKQSVRPQPRVAALTPAQGAPRGEQETIEAVLAECRGRVGGSSGAAAKLGVPP